MSSTVCKAQQTGEHRQGYEHLNKGKLLSLLSLFKAVWRQAQLFNWSSLGMVDAYETLLKYFKNSLKEAEDTNGRIQQMKT